MYIHIHVYTYIYIHVYTCIYMYIHTCNDFGVTLGSLWDHFGVTLGPLWGHFGDTLGSLWGHFGVTLGTLWDHFGSFWTPPTKMAEDAARCQIKWFVILRTPRRQRRREVKTQKGDPMQKVSIWREGGRPDAAINTMRIQGG